MRIQPTPPMPQTKPWSALQQDATQLGPEQNGLLHIGGVRWDIVNNEDGSTQELGVFRDTYIDPQAIQDVYLTIEPFSDKPGGSPGHAELHFEFKPESPVRDSLGNTDHGLALSVEPRFRQGEPWTPGGDEPQPILYQLGTWTDSIEKATVHNHYPLHFYKMNLSQDQKESLLRERLQVAVLDHSQDIYDPVTNSCISTLVDGVNKIVPAAQQIQRKEPGATVPVWSPGTFKKHHLLAQNDPTIIPGQPK